MRSIKFLFILIAFFITSLSLTNCKNDEGEKNLLADSLRNANGELAGQLTDKAAALQEFIDSFNEIQENLNSIKEKEKLLSNVGTKGDVKNKGNQIKEDIQAIYDLMALNKNKIASLNNKLNQSNLKLSGMEKMIENLQNSLNEKEEEIVELKARMEALNVELANMNTNYKKVESENAAKTEALNTAYYTIGTTKELQEKKIITKEGGFVGMGKSTKVSSEFDKSLFTKINIEQIKSINIGAKKVKFLTTHPASSYKLIGTKPIEKIEILNSGDFWAASKYLVIVID